MQSGYMDMRMQQHKDKEVLEERKFWINDEINEDTEFMFIKAMNQILESDKVMEIKPENAQPISLQISSYGGCVHSTLSIISKIEQLKDMGYIINGYAHAKAMSGAFKIFISCSKRYAYASTDLMCHQPLSMVMSVQTMEDKRRGYLNTKRLWRKCRDIITKYTNITEETLEWYNDRNDNYFMWGEEAIKLGVVDELM